MHTFSDRLEALSPEMRLYAIHHLPAQLVQAGERERLHQLLACFGYLQAKLNMLGAAALISDFMLSSDPDLERIHEALRLSAHILGREPSHLATQLLGRLMSFDTPRLLELLREASPGEEIPWLRPLTSSLIPPGGPLLRTLDGHTDSLTALVVTPDGKRAVSVALDRSLRVWNLETGEPLLSIHEPDTYMTALAITYDGKRVLSGAYDGTLKLRDLDRGEVLLSMHGHTGSINAVAITPDGQRAVSAAGSRINFNRAERPDDYTLRVWDLNSGSQLRVLQGHTTPINSVAIMPDGRRVISAAGHTLLESSDNTLKVWDLETGHELAALSGHPGPVTAVVVTQDGQQIISAGSPSGHETPLWTRNNVLKIWDPERRTAVRTLSCPGGSAEAIALLPTGQHLISLGHRTALRLWDLKRGMQVLEFQDAVGNVLAMSPDGRLALTATHKGPISVWDMARVAERHENAGRKGGSPWVNALKGHEDGVLSVTVTPDGKRILSGARDQTIRVWDLEAGQELLALRGHTGGVTVVVALPCSQQALSASLDGTLKLWDLHRGVELATLKGHTSEVRAAAVTPDGRLAVSGGGGYGSNQSDNTLRVWDLKQGHPLRVLAGHRAPIRALALTPDGRRVISSSGWRTAGNPVGELCVWDLETGERLFASAELDWIVTSMAIPHEGRFAILGCNDAEVRVWNLERCEEEQRLSGHTNTILGVAVLSNDQRAVSVCADATIKAWDLKTGAEVFTLLSQNDSALAMTPDDHLLVSAAGYGFGNAINLWDMRRAEELGGPADDSGAHLGVVTPDGRLAVIAYNNRRLHLWDLAQRRRLTVLGRYNEHVHAIAPLPDSRHVITALDNGRLKVWDLQHGREVLTLQAHSSAVVALAVSPDGRLAASGSLDRTLKIWDLVQGAVLDTLEDLPCAVCQKLTISADGRYLVAIGMMRQEELHVWDLAGAGGWRSLQGHTDSVRAVVAHPRAPWVLSGAADRSLKAWNLERDEAPYTARSTANGFTSLAVSANGRFACIVSGASSVLHPGLDDSTLQVWRLDLDAAPNEFATPLAYFSADSRLSSCAMSPDGRTVVGVGRQVHLLRLDGIFE